MLTFWLCPDADGVAGDLLGAVARWLDTAWTLPGWYLRLRPVEVGTLAAAGALGLREVAVPARSHPGDHLWFTRKA